MNIDDVLLTHKEQNTIWNFLNSGKKKATNRDLSDAIAKAAQLKLLEWLKELCDEHVGADHTFRWLRRSCPECMSELESKLKEG